MLHNKILHDAFYFAYFHVAKYDGTIIHIWTHYSSRKCSRVLQRKDGGVLISLLYFSKMNIRQKLENGVSSLPITNKYEKLISPRKAYDFFHISTEMFPEHLLDLPSNSASRPSRPVYETRSNAFWILVCKISTALKLRRSIKRNIVW